MTPDNPYGEVVWPRWVEPTKARVMQALIDAAEGKETYYFSLRTVSGFLRASGKAGVTEFVLTLLEKDGMVERVSKEMPRAGALWRLVTR